ncbi:MAG: Grx4 family monothiol glutaredoxin [Myxococcales bacterium]|nr:Grx4 family monothiol glutaredoxin [Myxococcales bacterium]MCB9733135.1 Grx4 family monothiol glutaredoxin [Deltaproteobacteria bacterium]
MDATQQKIDQLVKGNDVILFMKGTRVFPQCGFSATVVQLLDELLPSYETVNVLADADMRQGIKTYSDWPTIPQLYVKGEFIGGCDIVKQLYATGELQKQLGVTVEEVKAPTIRVSAAAAEVLKQAAAQEGADTLRFEVGPQFQYGLGFGQEQPGDLVVEAAGLRFVFDRGSAKRSDGLSLDYDAAKGGFNIDNPNAPPGVRQISTDELAARLAAGGVHLYDVRTPEERAEGYIPGSKLMTAAVRDEVMALPKDTPLYFSCRSGGRSQQAAEGFIRAGFREVYNVAGGILAWKGEVAR